MKQIGLKVIVGFTIILMMNGCVSKVNSASEKEALGLTESTLSGILATEYMDLLERATTLLPDPSVLFSNEEQYNKTISSMARECMKLDKSGFSFKDCSSPLLTQMIKEDVALDKFQKNYIYAGSKYTSEESAKIILKHEYYKALGDVTVQYKKISEQDTQIQIKWNQNINEPYFENFKQVVIHKINLRGMGRITAIEIK